MQRNVQIDKQLLRIAHYLILNTGFLRDISLSHGKMSIAVFFFHYSRYSGNSVYTDYAWDLIEEIYKNVHNEVSVNFENGLGGIGFGIEYLVQNKFMEGNTGEVLEDLDKLVMEKDPRRIKNFTFEKGLGGIYYYVSMHTNSCCNSSTSFDTLYLKELEQASISSNISSLATKGYPFFDSLSPLVFPAYLLKHKIELKDDADITQYALGIENGLAGLGLQLMEI